MRSGFFRRASTGAAAGAGAVSLRNLLAEFVVVVAGILVALGIDNWRQHRQELRMVAEHLSDVALEVGGNVETVEHVQRALERKRQALETVITFLKNEPGSPEEAPEKVLRALAVSTQLVAPWLRDNQFQALQNSGNLRLLRNSEFELADDLAASYAMPGVLFSQVLRLQSAYPAVVQGLLPARMQSSTNPLRNYVRQEKNAPLIADDEDIDVTLDRVRARRGELLPLARSEAAVCTAEWYALERMRLQLGVLLKDLPPVEPPPT